MNWETLYISGRPGFDREVMHYLDKSGIDFMTGSFNEDGTYLFWVPRNFALRTFKNTVGSKAIFRFRIRFFFTIDDYTASREKGKRVHRFSPAQEQMFRDYSVDIKNSRYRGKFHPDVAGQTNV